MIIIINLTFSIYYHDSSDRGSWHILAFYTHKYTHTHSHTHRDVCDTYAAVSSIVSALFHIQASSRKSRRERRAST